MHPPPPPVLAYPQVGASWALAALNTLSLVVWGGLDSVRYHQVACVKKDDAACAEVLKASPPAICSLPRDSWQWTSK